jgi:hypothetical protein
MWQTGRRSMPTFTYSPTDSVTIAPNGDVSLTNGATTTTFTKTGATKTVTKTPPDATPPAPETPLSQKTKPNGDIVHTYSDITKTPPVTTRITFKANGDVEILVTIGQDRTMTDINSITGLRRTKIWKDPDPEPEAWSKTESPKSGNGAGSSSGNGSKNGKKPKKHVRRSRPAKRRVARRAPKRKAKKKARRR